MTAYKKTMREALQEVSSFKVKKEEKENQSFIGPEPLPDFDDEGEEVNTTPHEVELDEGKMKDLVIKGQDLEMYAKKSGGVDKDDMMKVAAMLKKGDKSGALKYAKGLDTDPRDYILKMMKEEVELDEAKQKPYVSSDRDGKHVMNASGGIAKSFKDMDSANAYLKKNYNKLMKEKLDKEDEPTVKAVVKMLKKASNAHAGQAKDLEKAVKEDSEPVNEILPALARVAATGAKMVAKPIARKVATKAVSKVNKPQEEQEGFASDAQRRAAFASGYKEKGTKKDESAASDARRAMASDPSTKQKFSKNVSATDDDVKAADKNIIMQMRKAVSLRGNKVEFMDKKKVMIPQKIAQAVIAKYNNMKKPADKEKFQSKISKSYKSMLTTLKERNEINNKNNSLDQLKELVKEMKGKNNG